MSIEWHRFTFTLKHRTGCGTVNAKKRVDMSTLTRQIPPSTVRETKRVKTALRKRVDWAKSAAALLRKTARPTLTAAQSAELLAESRGRY